jgi:hypothetical protein
MYSMPPKNNYYRKKEGPSGVTYKNYESEYDIDPREYKNIQTS